MYNTEYEIPATGEVIEINIDDSDYPHLSLDAPDRDLIDYLTDSEYDALYVWAENYVREQYIYGACG